MKNIFASLGVLAALVGTAVCGAMLCMGNASADAAALKDKSGPASAAVSLEAEPSIPWGDVEVHYDASSLRYISTNEMGEQVFLYGLRGVCRLSFFFCFRAGGYGNKFSRFRCVRRV